MSLQASKFCVSAFTAAAFAIMLSGSAARAADNFDHLKGNWSGGGNITLANGEKERIRCRATYIPVASNVKITLRCASDSYKFELASDISYEGGKISGSWNETSRGVVGSLTGKATATNISATAQAIGFTADLSIRASGNSLAVSIRSPGSEISEVAISMSRGR